MGNILSLFYIHKINKATSYFQSLVWTKIICMGLKSQPYCTYECRYVVRMFQASIIQHVSSSPLVNVWGCWIGLVKLRNFLSHVHSNYPYSTIFSYVTLVNHVEEKVGSFIFLGVEDYNIFTLRTSRLKKYETCR